MKRGKIDTSQSRATEKSPRGSFSERSPLINTARTSSYPRNNFAAVEEELAQLPYKDSEIEKLAKEIGIDFESEKDKYLWFLVQVVNLDLPPGWMKEEDPSGAISYVNPTENITSAKHPMIAKFRSLFNEILENEINGKAKTLALKEKVQKLEKEVEVVSPKKPIRETVLKLDKAKKFKAAATAIAMTAALSHKTLRSESNLTKPVIPEQAMSIVDSEKTKQKFNKVKDMLEKRRAVQEKKVNEIDNLVKTEDILNMCKQYYINQFGSFHKEAPPELSQLETFDLVDPMELIEAARLFNVRSNQAHLFWTLRAYCGLPLPEYWTKMYDTNMHREIYYNSAHDVKISVKPCYFYILELVNYIKQESMKDRDGFLNASNKLTLCDKLGREYDVDLAAMIKDLIEKQNVERKNYFNYHQKKETAKEEAQKVTKRRKKDEFNPNYSDAHFVEIAKQLGIDLNKEIHLLMTIEDFVRNKEGLERWYFRQAQEGQCFWVNHEQQKAVNRYPYLNDLKKVIDDVRANQKLQSLEAQKHLKSDFNLFKMLFRKQPEDVAKKMLQDEARNYLEFFLKMKGDGQINNLNLDTKGYNLTNLMRKIGMQLTKSDLMDLLFYCPFDFTHFIGEDFLKSSENYLLRKINLKLGDAKKSVVENDDDDLGPREGSFDSQGSNDSAKHIKLKIEDSKKLLDLASNIKGLSLDPDRKREFMKLLIDFDQKYGDRDLVDALEQDVTGKIHDGASSAKSLASSLKNKMGKGKSINSKDADDLGSSGLYGLDKSQKFLIDAGKDSPHLAHMNSQDENYSNNSRLKRTGDPSADQSNSSRLIPKLKPDGKGDSSRDLKLNKKGIKSDGYNLAEGREGGIGDDDIYSAGLATDRRQRRDHKDRLKRQKSKFGNNNNGNEEDEPELDEQGQPTGRSRKKREGRGGREGRDRREGRDESDSREDISGQKSKKHKKRRNGGGTNSGGNSGSFGNLSGAAAGSRSRSGVSSVSGTMENVGEEDEDSDEELSSSNQFSEISESENDDDVYSEARYDNEGRRIRKKKNANKSNNSSRRREKLEYDENGKIIFTNKRTQKLLEELAEEEFRLSARHKFKKKRNDRHRSAQASMEEDEEEQISIFGQGKLMQAFGDHKIVYHEVVMENGETKVIAINVKNKTRRPRKSSNATSRDSLDESRSPPNGWDKGSPSPADFKDSPGKLARNLSKKVAAELNQSRDESNRGLPIVIGASLQPPGQNRADGNNTSRFDPNQLFENLHKYNVDALDEAYHKEERRKEEESANRLSYLSDSKVGDATGLSSSRVHLTPLLWHKASESKKREPIRIPQTYRNLSNGLQNLDLVRKKNTYEKTGKQGVWTHVEVFEMKPGPEEQKKDRHNRAASETLKVPASARTSVSPRHANVESTFFTPFRQGNLGLKRFIEYMSYLNTLVFIKKLDTLITNFLMKQFAAIQQTSLGINFNPNDPKFRNTFKTRYHKLIRQLRENLLKKKDFLNNIYAKVFNSAEELPESIFQSVNQIRDIPNSKDVTSGHQSFVSGQNPRATMNRSQPVDDLSIKPPRSSSLKGSQSQMNLHLPKVGGRRPGLEPFRLSQKGFFTPRARNDEEKFADNNIRNTEAGNEDTPLKEIKNPLGKINRGHLTLRGFRENEANKILQALSENDQENYRHYWNILGDPLKLESAVTLSKTAPPGVQPYHVLLMARRLGLQVHNSEEHDLAWIAYLALTVKLPSSVETNLMITSPRNPTRYQKVCNMKPGEHPGDKYFRTVLVYNQLRRRILFENMTQEDQTRYIKSQSWVKLKEESGSMYYHNFMTKQKTINLPSDQKEIVSRVSALTLRSDIKERLILTNQTIMENDHLLNFFKNKLPTH